MSYVTCGTCTLWTPDTVNPVGGAGRCQGKHDAASLYKIGGKRGHVPYPNAPRICGHHTLRREPSVSAQ